MPDPRFAMLNGVAVPYAQATVHVDTPGLGFAATVFEGLRAYRHPASGTLNVFRLHEHAERLMASMRILRFEHALTVDAVAAQVLETIRINQFDDDSYVRVVAYIEGPCVIGTPGPVSLAVTARMRGRGAGAERPLRCAVSSWTRIADNAMPARAKAAANYVNSRLAAMQVRGQGFDAALLLGPDGKLTEAHSSCLFMVRGGELITPPVTSGILESVTRATVMALHAELTGRACVERPVDRSEAYLADEIFLCGTGQEVAPVGSVDGVAVGDGGEGPVTRRLRERYFAVVRGLDDTHAAWRTPVDRPGVTGSASG